MDKCQELLSIFKNEEHKQVVESSIKFDAIVHKHVWGNTEITIKYGPTPKPGCYTAEVFLNIFVYRYSDNSLTRLSGTTIEKELWGWKGWAHTPPFESKMVSDFTEAEKLALEWCSNMRDKYSGGK